MGRTPGKRTTSDWRVGKSFIVSEPEPRRVGTCVSVTPWGNDQLRWVRLRFQDGSEKSFAPSHLRLKKDGGRAKRKDVPGGDEKVIDRVARDAGMTAEKLKRQMPVDDPVRRRLRDQLLTEREEA